MLLALFLGAVLGTTWLCAKAPPRWRLTLLTAVLAVTVLTVACTTPSPATLVVAAAVVAVQVHLVATSTDWRYALSKLVPMPMVAIYQIGATDSTLRSTWVQWRGHVVRHRHTTLPG